MRQMMGALGKQGGLLSGLGGGGMPCDGRHARRRNDAARGYGGNGSLDVPRMAGPKPRFRHQEAPGPESQEEQTKAAASLAKKEDERSRLYTASSMVRKEPREPEIGDSPGSGPTARSKRADVMPESSVTTSESLLPVSFHSPAHPRPRRTFRSCRRVPVGTREALFRSDSAGILPIGEGEREPYESHANAARFCCPDCSDSPPPWSAAR